MIYFFLGLALLALLLYGLNGFSRADTAKMAKPVRYIGGGLCLVLALFLGLRGLYLFAIPVGAFGFGMLLGKRRYFSGMGRGRYETSSMSHDEALQILGLKPDATKEDVLKAHKKKMKENHPDAGGSEEAAKKINMAKDYLLKNID